MKKIIALLLALTMAVSLFAGCGKGEPSAEPSDTPTANAPSAEDIADESWKEEHPTWLCEEKTTLSVYTWDGVSSIYPAPSNDLYFWQWLEDYTNVHIEWEVVPFSDYGTLISTKLASGGELNDIIVMQSNASVPNNAGANGLLIDLSPIWDECFTNTQAYMDNINFSYKQNITNADGTLYAICTLGAPTENRVILIFNTQWMKDLNLEIPTTIDELTEVLRTMKAAGDLNGNGKDDEIILTSPYLDWLTPSLHSSFDIEALENQPMFSADENGVVYDQYTSENNRALLSLLGDLYEEGILDQEIATNNMDIVAEKVAADRCGVISMYSGFATTYGDMTSAGMADPGKEYYTLGGPMTSEFTDTPYMTVYETYIQHTGISSDCENPELAARWLDTVYADPNVLAVRCRGEEGVTWEYDANGEAVPIAPADGSAWTVNHLGCGQISLPYIQTDEQLLFSKKLDQQWYLDQYQVIRDGEWRARTIPMVPGFTEEEMEIRDMYWADFNACWQEYRAKFATGELDTDADWAKFKADLEAFGLEELTKCYQSVYDRTH